MDIVKKNKTTSPETCDVKGRIVTNKKSQQFQNEYVYMRSLGARLCPGERTGGK